MPTHWTYESFEADEDLFQGDVLEPTEELRSIMREVHPHFLDPKYTAFLLTTQSCDLALRQGQCAARYLNIAVVRPLEAVLFDLLSHACRPVVEGVYLLENKSDAHRLMERIFNQNEQSLGLFYLHPDQAAAGIAEPSVSLLRVTVTLRIEHYDVIRRARRGRLDSEFRSKLGWLVGNLYSRIGTQDWSDEPDREKELKKLIKQFLDSAEAVDGPKWVPASWVQAAQQKGVKVDKLPRESITGVLESHKPQPPKEQAIEHVVRVVRTVLTDIDEGAMARIENRLKNDQLFAKTFR